MPALATAAPPVDAPAGTWDFRVFLDGKPIGSHRFTVAGSGAAREVTSRASFEVGFLGFTAYRYRHEAHERWRGDCLAAIDASTDDNGSRSAVHLEPQSDAAVLSAAAAGAAEPAGDACIMSFAYWHPALRTQARLLNAQTGKLEAVQVRPLAGASLEVQGRAVAASGWRIAGPAQPIDVWYDAAGRWIGLDSVVGGNRRLSYRRP